ncbi:MAG: YncE family protein, partial [Myxococcales bacterium]|nr:YncE family protein [Myxococcales bacterium]
APDAPPRPAGYDPAAPPPSDLVRSATLGEVKRNRWVHFGAGYWRLWGGALAGSQPKSVTVAASGAVYVTNTGYHDRDNVDRWDPVTLEVAATAQFKGNAVEQVLSPDQHTLYVSNFYHQEVLALDADTLAVTRRFHVGKVPKHMAISADGRTLYASNWDSGSTTIIDIATGDAQDIAVGREPRGTAASADGTRLYVVNFDSDTISVIDLATRRVVKTLGKVGCDAPRHAVVTRDDRWVLVTCYHGRNVVVIDRQTDEVVRSITVGQGPKTIDVSWDGAFAYTADYTAHSMSIIDLATWTAKRVPLPIWRASGLAVSHDDRRIYVTGWDSRSLVVVQRWLPGDPIGAVSPRQPTGACLRTNGDGC